MTIRKNAFPSGVQFTYWEDMQ